MHTLQLSLIVLSVSSVLMLPPPFTTIDSMLKTKMVENECFILRSFFKHGKEWYHLFHFMNALFVSFLLNWKAINTDRHDWIVRWTCNIVAWHVLGRYATIASNNEKKKPTDLRWKWAQIEKKNDAPCNEHWNMAIVVQYFCPFFSSTLAK